MSPQSIGLMWWFLAREVLRLRGSISRDMPWEVMSDLFFYRDPEEAEKEERERAEAAAKSQLVGKGDFAAPAKEDWGAEAAVAAFQVTEDWAAQTEASDWAAQSAPEGVPGANLQYPGMQPQPQEQQWQQLEQ